MKKQVIRIGDKVEIVNAKWIERIGYNLVWTDLIDEVENDPRTHEAMKVLCMWNGPTVFEKTPSSVPWELTRVIAKYRVKERGFGGNERKIHYLKGEFGWQSQPGIKLEVVGKRLAKTGTYFPPNGGGYDSWSGEYYDCDCGGLADCKTHIILKLENGYEIEACDVKLIGDVK